MKINIAYLYYDFLNLYGESGNIKALKKALESQGVELAITFISLNDKLNFNKYDFVYIGAGTEKNQAIAIKHLLKYKEDIKKYVEDGKFLLATGNSIDFFGKKFTTIEKEIISAVNILNYKAKTETFRMIDEAVMKCNFIDKPIIGFQNQSSVLKDNDNPLFKVKYGIGSYPNSPTEGVHYKNFYGTYLIGPILVRNPKFLEYICKELIKSKDSKFKFKKFDLKLETDAYNSFMNDFYKEYLN